MRTIVDRGTAVEKQLLARRLVVAEIEGGNRSGADLYLQLHDTAVAVASMDTCLYTLPVPAKSRSSRPFSADGLTFAAGLRVLWSTTEHSATAYTGAASDLGVWAFTPNPAAA